MEDVFSDIKELLKNKRTIMADIELDQFVEKITKGSENEKTIFIRYKNKRKK